MTHILGERLTELVEDAEQEKALKDVANDNAKQKSKVVKAVEKKAQSSEKAHQLAEKRIAEVESWLKGVELKLVEANGLNLAQANQIADLKAALKACENKWYDEGFTDVERSAEPVFHQAQLHGFGEGQLVAVQVMGVVEDSLLKDPSQMPYPAPPPPSQSQADVVDEEETTSMRELVQVIDTHVDPEVSSTLHAADEGQSQQPWTEDTPTQPTNEATQPPTIDPSV